MVKCEVINQNLILKDFQRLQNIRRIKSNDKIEQINFFEIGDTFETDEEYAIYLSGELENQPNQLVKILEITPSVNQNSQIDNKK